MNKKAFLHHPATWIVVAFILGMVVMYYAANGTIPLGLNPCLVKP